MGEFGIKMLKIPYPDGFHVMNEEERSELNLIGGGETVCLTDPDRHMTVTVGCRQEKLFAALMLGAEDFSKKMEQSVGQMMKQYRFTECGHEKRSIAGMRASGFSYEYESGGIGMAGQSFIAKSGRTVYYFHCYSRSDLKDENLLIWKNMLDGCHV